MANKVKMDALDDLINEVNPVDLEKVRIKMHIAATIDDLIKQHRWTKQMFAEKLGKQPSEITKWLSGTHNFTTDTLTDIAFVFGLRLSDLLIEKESHFFSISHYQVPAMINYDSINNRMVSYCLHEREKHLQAPTFPHTSALGALCNFISNYPNTGINRSLVPFAVKIKPDLY